MAEERLVVPDFANVDEFKKWVGKLDERAIQKWTAADWVAMYEKIGPLRKKSYYANGQEMVSDCANEFVKLYRNYRLEPEQLNYIRQIARQAGEELAGQDVDAAKLAIKTKTYTPIEVPDFKSADDFKSWVKSLDEGTIKKWNIYDWEAVFKKVDDVRFNSWNIIEDEAVKKSLKEKAVAMSKANGTHAPIFYLKKLSFDYSCQEEFAKLYQNSSLETEQKKAIEELMHRFYDVDPDVNVSEAKLARFKSDRVSYMVDTTGKIDDLVAGSTAYSPEHRTRTRIFVVDELGNFGGMAGEHLYGSSNLHIRAGIVDQGVETAAHESAHIHLQTGNSLQAELLQKNIMAHPELGKDFATLMRYNHEFYLSVDDCIGLINLNEATLKEGTPFINGYTREPMEKFSYIYGKEFERSFRSASGQMSERNAVNVVNYLNKTPQSVQYTSEGVEIVYRAEASAGLSGEQLLKELSAKFDESLLADLDIQLVDQAGKDVKITVPTDYKFAEKLNNVLLAQPEVKAVADFIGQSPSFVRYTDKEIELVYLNSAIDKKEQKLIKKLGNIIGEENIQNNLKRKRVFTTVTLPKREEIFSTIEQAGKTGKFAANTAVHGGSKSGGGIIGKIDNKVNHAIDTFVEKGGNALNNSKVGKTYARAKTAVASSTVAKRTKKVAGKAKDAVMKTTKKVTQSAPVQKAKTVVKATGKAIAQSTPVKALKQTGKAIAKSAFGQATKKAVAKTAIKTTAKAVGKSLLKKIPFISIGAGLVFGVQRAMAGDFAGAAGEVASGVCGTFPGVGTAASVAIDAGLAGRDIYNNTRSAKQIKSTMRQDQKKAQKYGAKTQRQVSRAAKPKSPQKQATVSKMKVNSRNAQQKAKTPVKAKTQVKTPVKAKTPAKKTNSQMAKAKSGGRE